MHGGRRGIKTIIIVNWKVIHNAAVPTEQLPNFVRSKQEWFSSLLRAPSASFPPDAAVREDGGFARARTVELCIRATGRRSVPRAWDPDVSGSCIHGSRMRCPASREVRDSWPVSRR